MNHNDGSAGRRKRLWLAAWPAWALLAYAGLAAVRLLPGGLLRATIAIPVLLGVPGVLTVGAVFSESRRPRGIELICYAALLGAAWSGFTALTLYACGVAITAAATFWGLLVASAALAVVAQVRIVLEWQGVGRRIARKPAPLDRDLSVAEAIGARVPAEAKGAAYYAIAAVVGGAGILGGGLYVYDHHLPAAPAGFTSLSWSHRPVTPVVSIGSAGTDLGFTIVHREQSTTRYRLTAAWAGASRQSLAKPLVFTIGPGKTYRGTLFVPPLPNGCTYRIVVTLAPMPQNRPDAAPSGWSINADVHTPGRAQKACR